MIHPAVFRLLAALIVLHAVFCRNDASASTSNEVEVNIGRSVESLNGPWRFHTGDDPHWADPEFDDSVWETVDLTPPPGAHDDDVGLSGWVPGWTKRGHPGYSGYAWYRMKVIVNARPGEALALTGPPAVDNVYQLFVDGHLLGSAGDFSGTEPVIYSIQPRIFHLAQVPRTEGAEGKEGPVSRRVYVIAFRVWMSSRFLAATEAGGIHIAPVLGEAATVYARYKVQWLETVAGYIVDVVEPLLFVLLAVMAGCLIPFDRANSAWQWLIGALLLTAAVRLNQATFFWGQFESLTSFDVVKSVILVPLGLGAWTMAWYAWFRAGSSSRVSHIPRAIAVLTLLYVFSQLLSRPLLESLVPSSVQAGLQTVSACLRLLFAILLAFISYRGIRQNGREGWLALPAILLVSVGLFAQELSSLQVPGIWFPFGTGVSRTQFAYAALDVALFILLLRRIQIFARRQVT